MAQFDVYTNTNTETAAQIPYLLNVQAELLDVLSTRVVIPLYRKALMPKPAQHLNPSITIGCEVFILSTAELAGVPSSILGSPIHHTDISRDEVIAALDFIFTGE